MSRFHIAKLSRPSILVFLAALVLAWAGASAAMAAEPEPTLESLLSSDPSCASPASTVGAAAEIPGLTPEAQLKGFDFCSPQCGYASCRGAVIGLECTRINGTMGTCSGPSLGKKCLDGLPMCVCA